MVNTSLVLKASLQQRANTCRAIREFFLGRNVLEVETQLLSQYGVTDLNIQNFAAKNRYLQTSPEYAMKRLLSEGSGDIFQICKAFRDEEAGRKHNPEFTMLEWYRLGFTHIELMNEMDDLLQILLTTDKAERFTYQELFKQYLNIDPLSITIDELKIELARNDIILSTPLDENSTERDNYLDLLMSHCIEPELGKDKPAFVYNYPASQAALAKINNGVAERFEVYYKGVELANGFHELTHAEQQLARFKNDNEKRKAAGLSEMEIDKNFINALEKGLPDCAGVALGIDRLLMLIQDTQNIKDVITYVWDEA